VKRTSSGAARPHETAAGDSAASAQGSLGAAEREPWYAAGLGFACTSCGRCCSGAQSYVWVSAGEAAALAGHFGLALDDFGRRYLRRVGMRLALLDGVGGDCVFLRGKLCAVYEQRPAQCRSFPWWPSVLASPESWQRTALECEGIGDHAPLVAVEVIDAARADKSDNGGR